MTWTKAGLWLIGTGSFVTVIAAVLGAPRATVGGLRFTGPLTSRRERLAFAGEATGLVHIAAGSVIVAVTEFAAWWFVGLVVATVAFTAWCLAVWKQHEYRIDVLRRRGSEQWTDPNMDTWAKACFALCASWRWCLLHPLDDAVWPRSCYRIPGAPARE